ncbi:MAG TPA: serine hydroxymethyltransferase [Acidimicrobiales bacterium]|nr:serine hydroxymethyltransferase [Acidimicrobiales bacterium]
MGSSPFDAWIANDDELTSLLAAEWDRQTTTVQLIASENFASPSVLAATGSVLTNKYAEGYPGRRYYGGNYVIDEVEDLARRRLTALFGADHANVQPHSGANANVAVYEALLDPGDTILAMRLDQGGHLTHGSPASITSKFWKFVSYGVTPRCDDPAAPGEQIDFDNVRELALAHRPKLIVAGATAYARRIDPAPFREIADEVGALLMFDSAHVAGLIVGGSHPNPVPYADVVTFTTHKTLRGPRGGAIVCREEHAKKIDSAVFPGQQGGPLEHVIAAKAVSFKEASQPSFSGYTEQIVANAKAFARALANEGFRLVSGGTENHMVLLDLRDFDQELTGKVAQEVLDRAGITTNRNTIPDDPRSPFVTSGLRVGTAAETTAGMEESEFETIASLMSRALRKRDDEGALVDVRNDVAALCANFNPYANFTK